MLFSLPRMEWLQFLYLSPSVVIRYRLQANGFQKFLTESERVTDVVLRKFGRPVGFDVVQIFPRGKTDFVRRWDTSSTKLSRPYLVWRACSALRRWGRCWTWRLLLRGFFCAIGRTEQYLWKFCRTRQDALSGNFRFQEWSGMVFYFLLSNFNIFFEGLDRSRGSAYCTHAYHRALHFLQILIPWVQGYQP